MNVLHVLILLGLGLILLFIFGCSMAFGSVKVDRDRLPPGKTPEDVRKKVRRTGICVMGLSVLLCLFLWFTLRDNPYVRLYFH